MSSGRRARMRGVWLLAASALLAPAAGRRHRGPAPSPSPAPAPPPADPLRAAFDSWKAEHGVSFESAEVEAAEFAQWVENDATIKAHNAAAEMGFELGHNEYSSHSWSQFQAKMSTPDLHERRRKRQHSPLGEHVQGDFKGHSWEQQQQQPGAEGEKRRGGGGGGAASRLGLSSANANVPPSRDWVSEGAVSRVYNQANCGSCWSFSSTGAIEGLYFVQTRQLVPLSQQQLLACDYGPAAGRYRDNYCGGGLPDNAFGWTAVNGGLCRYDDYPYVSGNGKQYGCLAHCAPAVTVSGFKDVRAHDEGALLDAVAQQPVSVGIDASDYPFMFYKRGVLDTPKCGDKLDHAVLVVGYGVDEATAKPYWKVKNSWGPSWGESGFVRLRRGVNMCGIAAMPSYPVGALAAPRAVHAPTDVACNAPAEGDVKLSASPAGTLLEYTGGEWHTVCADTSDSDLADVSCRLLGYQGAIMLRNRPAPAQYTIAPGRQCRGTEGSVAECKAIPIQPDDWCATYPVEMAAYVKCYGAPTTANGVADAALKCGSAGWNGRSTQQLMAEAGGGALGAARGADDDDGAAGSAFGAAARSPAAYALVSVGLLFAAVGVALGVAPLRGPLERARGAAQAVAARVVTPASPAVPAPGAADQL